MLSHARGIIGATQREAFVGADPDVEVAYFHNAPRGTAGPMSSAPTIANTTLVNSTAIPHPAPGYKRVVEFWLVGTASLPGYAAYDGYYQPQATGEMARLSYTLKGDETSFVLEQWGWNNQDAFLRFKVIGGQNNNCSVDVGSASRSSSNTWGASGCPTARAVNSMAFAPANTTLVKSGAKRPYDGYIGYSDNTSYPPDSYASYGSTTADTLTRAGTSLSCWYGTGSGYNTGLLWGSTYYGQATQYSYGGSTNINYRSEASFGGCLMIWKNKVA